MRTLIKNIKLILFKYKIMYLRFLSFFDYTHSNKYTQTEVVGVEEGIITPCECITQSQTDIFIKIQKTDITIKSKYYNMNFLYFNKNVGFVIFVLQSQSVITPSSTNFSCIGRKQNTAYHKFVLKAML